MPITPRRQKLCFFITRTACSMSRGSRPEQQRREILDGADDRAGLPLERRLAPAEQAGLVGLDADEHPVAHLGVHHVSFYAGYSQDRPAPLGGPFHHINHAYETAEKGASLSKVSRLQCY